LYQDNQSAISLEKNGTASSSKRIWHINICHYFITDRVENGEVSVVICPTKEMIADFLTKPLQGAAFIVFWHFIMNVISASTNEQYYRSMLNNICTEARALTDNNDDENGFVIVTRKYRSKRTENTIGNKVFTGNGNEDMIEGLSIKTTNSKKRDNKQRCQLTQKRNHEQKAHSV
jgi:hypothetical protein